MSGLGAAWWALVSAIIAPVALVAGWLVAGAVQPAGYDPLRQTISALAAHGATDRWIMTTGLAALGACHLVTAAGLHAARPAGRLLLALGGAATLVVAAAPQPAHGSSATHLAAAFVAFLALAVWPAVGGAPSPRSATIATLVLLGLLVWLGVALYDGVLLGLAERLLAGGQALWPLLAVAAVRASASAKSMAAARSADTGFRP